MQPELQRPRPPSKGSSDRQAKPQDGHRRLRGRPQERGREVPRRRSGSEHRGHNGHRLNHFVGQDFVVVRFLYFSQWLEPDGVDRPYQDSSVLYISSSPLKFHLNIFF